MKRIHPKKTRSQESRFSRVPIITLNPQEIPPNWKDKLVANQEIGGVVLVFLSAKSSKDLSNKVRRLRHFCQTKLKNPPISNSPELPGLT